MFFFIVSPSTVALSRSVHSLGHLATDAVLRDTMKGALSIVHELIFLEKGEVFFVFIHQVYVSSAHRFHYRCGENNRIVKLNFQDGALDETPAELYESD